MTETIKEGKKAMEKAVAVLKAGGVIIFPTETSYGIGADALNKKAVSKVHALKQQPESKEIGVIVSSLEQIKKVSEWNSEAERLARKFFPGPLTVIVKEKSIVPANLTKRGIAFRIPSNKFAMELCKAFGKPITATSANIHGKKPIFDSKEAAKEFSGKADLVVDAGKLPKNKASTVYCTLSHKVLRKGKIKEKEIEKVLGGKNAGKEKD